MSPDKITSETKVVNPLRQLWIMAVSVIIATGSLVMGYAELKYQDRDFVREIADLKVRINEKADKRDIEEAKQISKDNNDLLKELLQKRR